MKQGTSKKLDNKKGEGTLRHTAEYLLFIKWIATPEPFRAQKTQGDFAASIQVSENTLSDWRKRDGFWDAVSAEIKSWGKDRTANVMAAVYKNILAKGGAQEAKLWLQYIEGWREEQGVLHKFDEPSEDEVKAWERIKRKHSKKK